MKKNIVRLTENQLKQIVNESIKKVLLNEASGIKFKPLYDEVIYVIDDLCNTIEDEYEISPHNDKKYYELYMACNNLRRALDDFFAHPDIGGDTKIWDNVGF